MRTWPSPGSETCRSTTRSTPGAETSTAMYVFFICVRLSFVFHSLNDKRITALEELGHMTGVCTSVLTQRSVTRVRVKNEQTTCFNGRVGCPQMTRSEPVDGAESRRWIRGYEASSSDSQSCAPTRPCRIQDCAQCIIRRRKITPSPQAGGGPSWGSQPQYSWREGFATPPGSLP